jgi:hypothetical protein
MTGPNPTKTSAVYAHLLETLCLVRKKRQELDDQIARLKAMRRLVDRVLQCDCVELPECGRIAASVMESASQ